MKVSLFKLYLLSFCMSIYFAVFPLFVCWTAFLSLSLYKWWHRDILKFTLALNCYCLQLYTNDKGNSFSLPAATHDGQANCTVANSWVSRSLIYCFPFKSSEAEKSCRRFSKKYVNNSSGVTQLWNSFSDENITWISLSTPHNLFGFGQCNKSQVRSYQLSLNQHFSLIL